MTRTAGASEVKVLNERLAAALGYGDMAAAHPRFSWRWAPDEPWYVYDRDERTIIRKSWADWRTDAGTIGRAWVLGQWRPTQARDHCGYGEGVRVAVAKEAGYFPYFETAQPHGRVPTAEANANYIWALKKQLAESAEFRDDSFAQYMAEEKYTAERNNARDRADNLERAQHVYDDNVGGFGNCVPGTAGGFLSWGGVGSSPNVTAP